MEQKMKGYLFRLLNHEELSREEMKTILIGITQSEYPNEQITALLTCLQMRGVTVDELLGFRDGILETGVPAILDCDRYIDVVGTGGDRKNNTRQEKHGQTDADQHAVGHGMGCLELLIGRQ